MPGPHAYAADQEHDPVAYGKWCVEETERIIEREGADTIAAMFVEPMQGAGGVIPPPEATSPLCASCAGDTTSCSSPMK